VPRRCDCDGRRVSEPRVPTRWVVAGVVLAAVVAVCSVVLVAALVRDDGGTQQVDPTTTTTTIGTDTTAPTTTAAGEPDNISMTEERVQVGGTERMFRVIEPADLSPDEELPVVIVLHGLGLNAMAMSRAADWRGAVAEDRFVAVFPQGVRDSWNMGPCCPPANLVGAQDEAFLDEVVASLQARDSVDAERMYLTGFSNGALLTYTYTCAHPETFAAVAPMAGTNVTGCAPATPVSLLHQHGDADLVVPYAGGVALGSLVSSAPFPPVASSVAAWARADGCSGEPTVTRSDGVQRTEWSQCSAGTRVEMVRVPGKGHEWLRTGEFDPLVEVLRFFGIS
jgi:polyhydroxybutyrate depolymerase